jgi:hypothetical protein
MLVDGLRERIASAARIHDQQHQRGGSEVSHSLQQKPGGNF